jgi:uncharacterized protein with gpF-like domain
MKLRAPGKQPVMIAPVRPNVGVQAAYARRLAKLIDAMYRDLVNVIGPIYETRMAMDTTLQGLLGQLRRKWVGTFNHAQSAISEGFSNGVLSHHDRAFQAMLSKGGFTVKFQVEPQVASKLRGITRENTDLIKSIPSEFFKDIRERVFESVNAGRKTAELMEHLHDVYGVTRRRAAFIARDQNNKATAAIHKIRQLSLGITQAKWRHTAASIHPRETHAAFDNETYDIELGHDFDDGLGPVQPGEAFNCGCLSSSIIPGYDDEADSEGEEQ